jgi:uridine kinase
MDKHRILKTIDTNIEIMTTDRELRLKRSASKDAYESVMSCQTVLRTYQATQKNYQLLKSELARFEGTEALLKKN